MVLEAEICLHARPRGCHLLTVEQNQQRNTVKFTCFSMLIERIIVSVGFDFVWTFLRSSLFDGSLALFLKFWDTFAVFCVFNLV